MGKLESITDKFVFAGAVFAYALGSAGNKLVQQIKQGYYHSRGIKYRKVTEIDDPDADFPYYARED